MQFNPDANKQANEVCCSGKSNAGLYLPVDLNKSPVELCESHKHLGIVLDKRLNFHEHITKRIKICNKIIGTIKHLPFHFPSKSLLLTYLLHGLTCVVPRVRGLHCTIVRSASTLGVDCPMP